MALVNAETKLYGRIRLDASRMVYDDPTTWDFPVKEIEQLHRFYSGMLACVVVHQRRMNAGENPPLSIALVFSIFTTRSYGQLSRRAVTSGRRQDATYSVVKFWSNHAI